jgi:hypothetical protein
MASEPMSSPGVRGCVMVSLTLGLSVGSSSSARTVVAGRASRASRGALSTTLTGIRVSGHQLVNGRGAPISFGG